MAEEMSEMYFEGEYLDLTVEANRRELCRRAKGAKMAKSWTITRDEAEYLVDVLEALPEGEFNENWRASDLAAELRELFGMGRKGETSEEHAQRLKAR